MDVGSARSGPAAAQGGREAGSGADRNVLMIAYDGTPNADLAVSYAGRFLSHTTTHVVTAWQMGSSPPARIGTMSGGAQPLAEAQLDVAANRSDRDDAAAVNARGVELASSVGMTAEGHLVEVESTVWGALVSAADLLQVDLLVTGTRGASGLRALLHSSVAERVLKHSHRPVFIVPAQCLPVPPVTL